MKKLILVFLILLGLYFVGGVNAQGCDSCKSEACGGYECNGWERVADGGCQWTKYGGEPNRWAIDWNEGFCGNIDTLICRNTGEICGPSHMHWAYNHSGGVGNDLYANWDFDGNDELDKYHVVWIFIPDDHATTTEGRYTSTIGDPGGPAGRREQYQIDQSAYSDQWVFGTSGYNGQNTMLDGFTFFED